LDRYETLRSQVASVEETHVVSPEILNTFRAGFSRAAFSYDPVDFVLFPASTSFVTGLGPGGIVIGGGVTTTGGGTITSAGTEQRRQRLESQKSVHLYRRRADRQRTPPDQRGRLVPAHPGQ
jgi:hypothetical protein